MSFIDTTIWVSALDRADELHEDGKSVIIAILQDKIHRATTSDYVLDETLTILKRRGIRPAEIIKVVNNIVSSPRVEVVFVDEEIFTDALELFAKYERLSFTDSTTLAIMQRQKINTIYSHDTDFDIQGIIRKERLP